eukprot:Clim_evm1s37 gene=Clim_evmTU1s37
MSPIPDLATTTLTPVMDQIFPRRNDWGTYIKIVNFTHQNWTLHTDDTGMFMPNSFSDPDDTFQLNSINYAWLTVKNDLKPKECRGKENFLYIKTEEDTPEDKYLLKYDWDHFHKVCVASFTQAYPYHPESYATVFSEVVVDRRRDHQPTKHTTVSVCTPSTFAKYGNTCPYVDSKDIAFYYVPESE